MKRYVTAAENTVKSLTEAGASYLIERAVESKIALFVFAVEGNGTA